MSVYLQTSAILLSHCFSTGEALCSWPRNAQHYIHTIEAKSTASGDTTLDTAQHKMRMKTATWSARHNDLGAKTKQLSDFAPDPNADWSWLA